MIDPETNSDPAPNLLDHDRGDPTSGSATANHFRASPCIFQVYFGICRNIDDCKFSHSISSIDSSPASGTTSPVGDGVNYTASGKHYRGQGQRPCKFFSSQGSCKRGDQCEFSHEKPKNPTSRSNGGNAQGPSNTGSSRGKAPSRPDRSKKQRKAAGTPALRLESTKVEVEAALLSAHIEELREDDEYNSNDIREDVQQGNLPDLEGASAPIPPPEKPPLANAPSRSDTQRSTFGADGSDNDTPAEGVIKPGHTFGFGDKSKSKRVSSGVAKERVKEQGPEAWGWDDPPYRPERVEKERANDEMDDAWFQSPEDETQKEEEETFDNTSGWEQTPEEGAGEDYGDDDGGWNEAPGDAKTGGETKEDSEIEWNEPPVIQETEHQPLSPRGQAPAASASAPGPSSSTKAQSNRFPSPAQPQQRQPPPSLSSQAQTPVRAQPPPVQPTLQPPPPPNVPQISVMSLHWSRFVDPTIDPDIPFCKAFAQNKCSTTSLEHCKWRHCLTLREYALLFKDPQPLQLALDKSLIRNDSPENLTLITAPSITLHWSHFADPTCDPNVPFCKPYAENMCPHGSACQFRHCLTVEEYASLFKDPQPNLIATTSGAAQAQKTQGPVALNPTHGSGSHSQVPAQQTAPSQPLVCLFFRRGTCRNGDNCPYYHDKSPSACPNVQSQGRCDDQGCVHCSSSTTPAAGPSKKVCRYWLKGTCKNGDNCPFAHTGEPDTTANPTGVEESHEAENVAEENYVSNTWGIEDNAAGWQANGAGDWGDEGHDAEEPQVGVTAGWGDQNNNNNDSGWGQRNDNGWGQRKNDNDRRQRNSDNDWGRRNNDNAWGNNNGNGGPTKNRWDGNSRDQGDRRNNICRGFLAGRCSYGSHCRYSHDAEVGRSGGIDPQDAPRPHRSSATSTPAAPSTSAAPARPAANSTYGGRHKYDHGFIEQWGQDVAVSAAGSEVGSPRTKSSSSRRGGRDHTAGDNVNRLVDHPPSGNACQFYLVGRCGLGDTCPSSHDPDVAGIEDEVLGDTQGRPEEAIEEGGSMVQPSTSGRGELKVEDGGAREETGGGQVGQATEIKEIAANCDDADHVVDNKWALDGQWDGPVEIPRELIKAQQPCLFYGQGYCSAGENCRFLHIEIQVPSREEEQAQQAQQDELKDSSEAGTRDTTSDGGPDDPGFDYGHPLVERSIFGCTVMFDRNCSPEKVVTGTDSHILLLSGDPEVTESRVHSAVNKYGPIEDILITQEQREPGVENTEDAEQGSTNEGEATPLRSIIRVEFKEMTHAAAAARDLGAVLADALVVEPASTTSSWVKFRWPQATRAAWVYYSTVTRAKAMAEKLHGIVFQDRKINASFLRPDKRQKDLYAVKLEKLPKDTTKDDLDDIVEDAKLVTMSELTYLGDPREVLRERAGIKSFVDIPDDPSKMNAMAFACCDSEESVLRALQMHGVKHKFLGKQELVVESAWFAHYILPTTIFKAISAEVAALHIRCEGRVHADYSEVGTYTMVYLHAQLEEDASFARANLSLQAICNGTVIKAAQNQPQWDEYFYTSSSTKVVENFNSKNSFYILLNTLTCQIHSLGSGRDRDKGVSTINKLLQKVQDSRREYPIHRNMIRQLLDGGLVELQGEAGANKVSLDVMRSILIVRGGDEVIMQKIKPFLAFTSPSKNKNNSARPNSLCPICELQPNNDISPRVELSCKHVYCTACLQHALVSATHGHSVPVKCIGRASSDVSGPKCDQPILYTTARDLLPLLAEPEYLKIAFTSFVLSHPTEYFFCPSLRCGAVYRCGEPGDTVRCPFCRAWICLSCRSMTHDGMGCREAQEAKKLLPA